MNWIVLLDHCRYPSIELRVPDENLSMLAPKMLQVVEKLQDALGR